MPVAPTAAMPANLSVVDPTDVLLVGNWQASEFAAALGQILDARDWTCVSDTAEATRLLEGCQQPPELILIGQPLPGVVSQLIVDQLQQLVPLSRIAVVSGSWCEGELRTGTPASGIVRLYWYELASWWQAAERRRSTAARPLWSTPLDHAQAGRWSVDGNDLIKRCDQLTVQIDTEHYATYDALATSLTPFGATCTWARKDCNKTATNAGIWDGGQLSKSELIHLTRFCQQINGPVVALLDFPRAEHLRQAREAGARKVLGKPYIVEEVLAAIASPTHGSSDNSSLSRERRSTRKIPDVTTRVSQL